MPPQKRGRAGYSGSRGGTRGRGNSASNGGTTDDENQRRRNNRTVRFEETSSNSLTNGSGAPPRPNRNQQFQRNTNRGARSTDQQTNGIAEATSEEGWRDPGTISPDAYKNKMSDHHQKLKQRRVKERAAAIANGLMSDPEKPTKLADAITLVGTCRDMCAEHERVERVVANEVDDCEKIRLDSSSGSPGRRVPFEEHMVKRFNRSSAGKEEELPSDVRPPLILQKTVDYLFNELLESNRAFPSVQDFIWNRTRAIRVDFSIQHISKLPDLRIAIDCLERIARFHIVSLHQRSLIIEANEHFSHKQEADQLKNTLLSLSYYYNDSRHRLQSPNEAEFRAYSIIYFLQNNETEQEAQNWPKNTLWAPRVQQALKLYAAAGNTMDSHGPLVPNTSQSIAQGNYGRFWKMVGSKEISYLMACTAEIHFNRIRKAALTSIWKSRYRPKPTEDWELNDLIPVLGFDSTEQVRSYCEAHGFRVAKGAKGISYVDFTSVSDRISDPSPPLKQTFSARLVESKRYDRTLTAIINGIPASTARDEGMTEDLNAENSQHSSKQQPESLFVQDDSEEELPSLADLKPTSIGVTSETDSTKPNPFANPFAPAIKRNPFVKDDGLDTLTDAKPTAPSNPFNNTQPSQLGSQSPSSNTFGVQPFASAFSSASTPPTSPFALTSTVSVPPRSTFGLPSGPTVAPETSSNLTFTSVFHLGPAKSESKNENTTTSADKPSESTTSIFQPPNSQALSEKPSTTQKPNPFLPTSNSSSIFGDPSSRTNAVAVAPQQPPNPFFPTADSPSIFGPASLSAKPVTAVPQQPSSLFPSNTNQPSIFGAPSSGKISTTAAPEQPASSIFPSKIDSPAILGAPSSSTKPTATTAQQPPNLFFPSSQPPSSSALQPSDNTFSFLNATPTTKPTSSALQPSDDTFSFLNASPGTKPTFSASQPSQTNPSSSNSAKSPKSNPFPATFIPPKDASTSPQFSFPKAGESPSTDQAKAPAPSQNQAAQQPPSAQGLFQNNTAKPQQSLTSAVDLLGSSNAAKNPPAQQAALHFPPTSQPANSATFEQLSKSVFLEQKGLLEQLIEYTASPIILDAMHQVEDEKLQKKKDEVIWRIMARRWLAIWKECTYRRGLARKGSERRRRYAEDMKKLVQASKRRTAEAEIDEYCDSRREQLQPSPPLKKPRVDEGASQHHQRGHQSRRSLPSEIGRPSQSINNTLPGTGQRDQNPKASNGIPFDGPTKTSRSHQRSRTHIDPSTLTRSKRTPQKISPSASTSLGSSFLSGKSTLSSSVLSKAHGLVPNGRIDTTRTPYFRMKAMGLTPSGFSKPETPTARRGTKRSRDHEDEGLGTSKSAKVTPPDRGSKMHVLDGGRDSRQRERLETGYPETPSTEGGKVNDEDEELFAQMRQVKEAMAESIQLCQQERARSEFSRSVSGGSGNGSKPQVKSDEGLQSFGSRHGCSREVWRDPPVGGAKATFEKQEEEEMEEVDGDADEVDNGGIEDDEEDEGEEEDEDRKEDEDEEELEFEDDEEVEDYEGQEIFEGENDSEFNENYSDSEEEEDDDNDSASTGESEDLADLTTTTTTTNSPSSNFLTGIISNNIRKPVVNQSTSSSAAGKGNTIEDAIEL